MLGFLTIFLLKRKTLFIFLHEQMFHVSREMLGKTSRVKIEQTRPKPLVGKKKTLYFRERERPEDVFLSCSTV